MLKTLIKSFGIFLCTLFSVCRTRPELALENLALRQQRAAMKYRKWTILSKKALENYRKAA